MRVLVLGASGMLGHMMFYSLGLENHEVWGTVREKKTVQAFFPHRMLPRILDGINAADFTTITNAVDKVAPDVIINCIGLVSQRDAGKKPLPCIEINARLPHLILSLAKQSGIRLIHFSTDCVFNGTAGPYTEEDELTPYDNYGFSKALGEVHDEIATTLRTSIIGHELLNKLGLVEWFLAQSEPIQGYEQVIFSGLTTTELCRLTAKHVIPNLEKLAGLFHVASEPISKYDLLNLIAEKYGKTIQITKASHFISNKSLNADKFAQVTGYTPPTWPHMIEEMNKHHNSFLKEQRSES